MNFVENCRTLIGFDTSPGQSNQSMIQWLSQLAESNGLHVETQVCISEDVEQSNIIIRPSAQRAEFEFLLQAHLDTADPGPFHAWKKNGFNPFDATIEEGRIYGLGSADSKLDFLCKLNAMIHHKGQTQWKLPPVLVGTFGEQSGMTGAMKLIRKNLVSPRFALIAEPTDLQIVSAAKGFACVEIRIPFSQEEIQYRQDHNLRESTSTQTKMFMGKAAHSSNPESGESAIKKMLDYLMQMPEGLATMEIDGGINYNSVPAHALLEIDVYPIQQPVSSKVKKVYESIQKLAEDFKKISDPDFQPSYSTLSIGLIRTFEDHVLMMGNCCIPPKVTQAEYLNWIEYLKNKCDQLGVAFRVLDYKKPFRTPDQSAFLRGGLSLLSELGLSPDLSTQPSTNEASLFSRVGADCLCFGAGHREGNIHTPEENVKLQDLQKAQEFYTQMIERFSI